MKRIIIALLAMAATVLASCTKEPSPTSMSFSQTNYTLTPGSVQPLQVNFMPSGTTGTVRWVSSNTSVATVDNKGVVTAISQGNTTITAISGSLSCRCIVKVTEASPEDDKPGFTMRLMQFNVLQATSETAGHEWASVRKEPCFTMLNEISPDIVCCEEARKTQCNDFASKFPGYAQVKHPKDNIESNGGQRNLILYKSDKFEVLDWNKYWFSVDETASGDRFCPAGYTNSSSKTTQKMTLYVHFREKASKREFYVFCTHFFADVDDISQREKCVELSVKHIREIEPYLPVFFCGDLNINYVSSDGQALLKPMFEYMQSAAMSATTHDSPTLTTYNKFGASTKVLDYIFYRNATAQTYKVVNSPNYGTTYISDHYPIYADIKVGK